MENRDRERVKNLNLRVINCKHLKKFKSLNKSTINLLRCL